MDNSLKTITARNISYNAVATVMVAVTQFLTTVILARVLAPADYGIVGFSQIFINFMMQFGDFGINNAIVQRSDLDDTALHTAFTLKVVFSIGLFLLLLMVAPCARLFLDRQEVTTVIRILSCNFLFSVAIFLPQTSLTRDLDFKKITLVQMISIAISSVCAIFMAFNGFGLWSLVASSLMTYVLSAVLLNILKPVRPIFCYDRQEARRLLNFGVSILIPGVIIFIIFNTDNFVIGAVRGAEQLGYYAVAFNWGSMICVLMAGIFHKVLTPTFSKFQHDIPALKKAYLTSVRYITFLAVPVNVLLALYGREFLVQVLGRGTERWLPALLAMQILCCYGVLRAVLEPIGNVIFGIGKPELCLKAIVLVAAVELGLLYPAISNFGITGVAVAVTIAYISQYLVYLPLMKRELGVVAGDLICEVRIAAIAVGVMAAVMCLVKQLFQVSLPALVLQWSGAALVYLAVYTLIDRGKLFGELKALAYGK